MNEILDIEVIYRQERERWFKEEAPRKSVRDVIADSVPYWIVLVAIVLYGLSAPHTASVFDKLTPGWGWLAPIGVEFGLLYAAFRRRLGRDTMEKTAWTLWALEALLFVTAMLVNGTGAFASVVLSTQLDNLSFAAIVERFGILPATSQAALIMAGLAAFIIPIGALVAGEGLAALALERRSGVDFREIRWREVEHKVIYRAVFVRYLQSGLPDKEARLRAQAEVKGYLGTGGVQLSVQTVRALSEGSVQAEQRANGQVSSGAKAKVYAYLAEHPEAAQLSVNQLLSVLHEQGVQAGRTTVAEVLRKTRVAQEQ
ncbi:MAG: hypothetical protein IT324_29750 [Anaerolineae bacterium]|nr:hypothetical protein [Anaerolineae bacterium]